MKIKYHLQKLAGLAISAIAVVGGLSILVFGEMGSVRGDGVFGFDGLERLIGLVPIAFGAVIAYGIYLKWKQENDRR